MSVTASVLTQLREHMAEESVNLFFEDSKEVTPILAHAEMRSMQEGFGRKYIVPVEYAVGFNAAFNDTVPTAVGVSRTRWEVDPVTINVSATWTRDDIDAAKGDAETFDVITSETDAKTQMLRNLIAQQLTGRGWGSLGTVIATNAAYLTTQASVVNRVEIGMILRSAVDEATSALSGAAATVTGIDPDTGQIFVAADPTGTWAVGDHIFISGSRQDAAPPTSRLVLVGLKGWLDPTAPSGGSGPSPSTLFNVARANVPQLSGYRIDASALDHEQALIRAANRLKKFAGVRPDTAFVSNEDWEILAADKSSVKTLQITNANKYQMSFEAVQLLTDGGVVNVLPDAFVPQGTAWMGPFGNKKYSPYIGYSGESLVNIDNKDGLDFRRKTDGTVGYEMLLYCRLQYIVPAPGKFAVITNLPAV